MSYKEKIFVNDISDTHKSERKLFRKNMNVLKTQTTTMSGPISSPIRQNENALPSFNSHFHNKRFEEHVCAAYSTMSDLGKWTTMDLCNENGNLDYRCISNKEKL